MTELRGFCDASRRAYASCVYQRVHAANSSFHATSIASKTKVAPVKTLTIPRLELYGALVLTRVIKKLQFDLDLSNVSVINWTDSEVMFCWIQGHASKWPTFVSHRVAEIQGSYPANHWRHLPTSSDPADKTTRGLTPAEIHQDEYW